MLRPRCHAGIALATSLVAGVGGCGSRQTTNPSFSVETAQARASAFYMALAPGVILLLYYFVVDPEATEKLFTTFGGQMILSAALVLNVVAYLWARQILSPDI